MSIFVYIESVNGIYKKAAFEALSYAKNIADKSNTDVVAISINAKDLPNKLYQYGASRVISIRGIALKNFDAKAYAEVLSQIVDGIVIFSHTVDSSAIASMLAICKKASLISNVVSTPENFSPFTVNKKVFSGKAFMKIQTENSQIIITISQNSFNSKENPVDGTEEIREISLSSTFSVISQEKSLGILDVKEAEIVVSAGRGLKSPENWKMIEDLAEVLGAAIACSKPVSDVGWRSHNEHVGQTGKIIAPNLYIAIGISGSIQHLSGINASKTIVVINSDANAPFFKSADYGVIGDAFQIVPILTEKIRKFKG